MNYWESVSVKVSCRVAVTHAWANIYKILCRVVSIKRYLHERDRISLSARKGNGFGCSSMVQTVKRYLFFTTSPSYHNSFSFLSLKLRMCRGQRSFIRRLLQRLLFENHTFWHPSKCTQTVSITWVYLLPNLWYMSCYQIIKFCHLSEAICCFKT